MPNYWIAFFFVYNWCQSFPSQDTICIRMERTTFVNSSNTLFYFESTASLFKVDVKKSAKKLLLWMELLDNLAL